VPAFFAESRHISAVGLNGRAKVDVVLFDPAARGDFARTDLARVAIEFKGGAYGNRNALRDTVRPGRPIDDLEKLAALPGKSLERWFLCIDLPSLGRALTCGRGRGGGRGGRDPGACTSPTTVRAIRRSPCARRVATLRSLPVPAAPAGTSNARSVAPLFGPKGSVRQWLTGQEGRLVGSEDVLVSQIYHGLRRAGFGAQQVSLETYYSFATGAPGCSSGRICRSSRPGCGGISTCTGRGSAPSRTTR
jgi:hypothetical protein